MRTCHRATLCLIGILVASSAIRHATAGETDLDNVYQFIERHALNRTMVREEEGTIADGKIAYHFRREATLCNLVGSQNHFQYDVVHVITQRNWDIQQRERVGEPRVEDRILVSRYEFVPRKSTGEILGTMATLTSTRADFRATVATLKVALRDERLMVHIESTSYGDFFDKGGKFYPGAYVDNQVWFVQDGKLVRESRMSTFRVDPQSGKRQQVDGGELVSVEKERAKLPRE